MGHQQKCLVANSHITRKSNFNTHIHEMFGIPVNCNNHGPFPVKKHKKARIELIKDEQTIRI